jgi:diguanylate cyclase (GGDEF)-like protein
LVTQFSALSGGHSDIGSASMRSHLQPAQSLHEKIDHLDAMAQRMRQDEMRAKAIVEHAGNAIFTVDPEGLLRQVNAAGARLLGYEANALIGTSIRRHILGELVSGENRIYQIDAPDIAVELSVSPVEGTNMLTVVARDITLDKKREAQLAHAARHDALTGLANRVALMEELDGGSNDGQPATLFFLDLDGFKAVNDTWGHAVGDELLVAVSRRLVSMLREGDLAARYGGDEFVAIVYGLPDNSSAIRFGKRLIETIEVPFQLGQRNVTISTSVGVVRRTENATAQDLLHRADIAAYGAKAAGKGNVRIHDPERAAWLRGRKAH